jgi:hypothetical protein
MSSAKAPREARRRPAFPVVLAALAAALALAPAGNAQTPPPDIGAVDEYREIIPSAGGGRPVDGDGGSKKARLPSKARETLSREGGSDTSVLEEMATSSRYGAPQESLDEGTTRAPRNPERGAGDLEAGSAEPSVSSAAASAVTEEEAGAPVGLLTALAAIAALLTGTAIYRHRRRVA